MTKRVIRFGSRKSELAVKQTHLVMDAVARAHPGLEVELVTMETTGDRNMKPFSEASDKFGIKGLFTQEIEEALRSGAVDVAVHSLKDMPTAVSPDLPIVASPLRGDPRDVLVLPAKGGEAWEKGPVGCSSARRRLQLAELFPEALTAPVRGNVNTRLRKLDAGDYSALVLAAAGLKRLGLERRIARYFETDEIVPAPGQGILACQGRAGFDYSFLDVLRDRKTEVCGEAERAFSAELGGGCTAPVGAFAEITDDKITITGFCADENGSIMRGSICGDCSDSVQLAVRLARRLTGRNG
ncbi:MAG: hydroxymethylbilane synthase [Synergistes sp.]|nr:hydroxymethylbilane synthase [Synergistes sp.]